MKKIFMMAVMAVAALTASAQQEAGTWSITPKAGINIANTNMEYSENGVGYDFSSYRVGFVGGVDVTYQVSDPFAVTAGVLYSQMGAKAKDDSKMKLSLDYMAIPVLANYYVCKGLAIKAGVEFDFKTRATMKNDGEDFNISSAKGTTMKSSDVMKDYTKAFQLMVPVGISYEFSNVILDARYNIGVTKFNKDGLTNDNLRNNAFQITLGYKIGLQ